MNTKDPLRAIGFLEAITFFIPRGDRAADQACGLRKQVLRQCRGPAFLGPGATAPGAQAG
eukprot:5194097-Alexandrium_andersonii.AAC.1